MSNERECMSAYEFIVASFSTLLTFNVLAVLLWSKSTLEIVHSAGANVGVGAYFMAIISMVAPIFGAAIACSIALAFMDGDNDE